jgi:hypothetical protein
MLNKKVIIILVITFVSIALWMRQQSVNYNEYLFAFIQTAMTFSIVLLIVRIKLNKWLAQCILFFTGWLASFLTSFAMEWLYTGNFINILEEQIASGDFLRLTVSWLIISFIYLGSFQIILINAVFLSQNKKTC